MTITQHFPHRGDSVEEWLKRRRDLQRKHSPEWIALDDALEDYRLHADTGEPIHAIVAT